MEVVVEGLEEYAGHQLRVLAKNENYIAQRVNNGENLEVLACTPDLISIIDSDTGAFVCVYLVARQNTMINVIHFLNTGEAITTELIRYGLRVGVVVLPANHMLKTKQALKVVGPKAFGFDIPYQEPRPFPLK